ncbi:MAG: hypothetical protein JRI32_07030 [Deltaproteobacteria bacterium]|nr:hypothetical protein [Deltaproteobacteria bacterium]
MLSKKLKEVWEDEIFYETKDPKRHQNQKKSNHMCPFVKNPYEDCYCYNMNTQEKIKGAIYYCGENFEECEIYLSLQMEKHND